MLQFILVCGMLFSAVAHAHASHHHHDTDDKFVSAADENFFLQSGPVLRGSTSYVILPNGEKYPLDSKAIRALQRLEEFFKEEDPSWYPAPWQRLADFIADATTKPFWVRFTAGGTEIAYRDGGLAVGLIGLGEFLEGAFLGHGFCKAVQSSCLFLSKHTNRFMNLILHRKPIDEGALERIHLSTQQLAWNFKFWRAMRNILISEKLITNDRLSKEAQYYLAQEKVSFLLFQLGIARDSIGQLIDSKAGVYLSLRFRLAQIGKAIDKYSIFIAGLALSGKPIENEETRAIDKTFQGYFLKWSEFLVQVERGSMPLTSALGKEIWESPRQILHDVRTLQIGECERTLLSPEVESNEEAVLDHDLPRAHGL
jgi:hypothetical protein